MKRSIILCISFLLILIQFSELFAQHSNIKNNIKFNSLTGLVKRIYNADIVVLGSSGIEKAKKYLELNNKLIGNKKELNDLNFVDFKQSHDVQHFFFKQNYNGIEVINSGIVISLNKENKITTVYSDYLPITNLNTLPSLDVIEAEAIAKNTFENYTDNGITGKSGLKIYVDKSGDAHLVYYVSLSLENSIPLGLVIVDSHNGSVLEKSDFGQSFVTGKGKVFDPDPGTYFRDATLTSSSNVDAAYKINVDLPNLDGTGKLEGKYARSVTFYNPAELAENSQNNFSYTRNQTYFKETNVYYFINKVREYIGTLGISPHWYGIDDDAIEYDAAADVIWAYGNNAVYFGQSDQERIGFGYNTSSPSTITSSDDQSVIVHEYGHALHDALISGGYESLQGGSDSQGISEGIGDYLAISFRRKLANGDFRPNHRSNYFRAPSDPVGIKSVSEANYSLWGQGDSYYNGAIWASTLMDLEFNTATNPASGNRLGRDVTTKLLLKSLNYIPITASAEDYVYAIFQADRDLYSGSHLSTLESVFDSRGFLSRVVSGGNITTNTTWSDKVILVTGNVTINSGVTLTIPSGAHIYFDNGISLTVNGGLNVYNTTFTSSSTSWGGIKFNSGSSGFLNNCTINNVHSYGGAAISIYNANPTIQYCKIENNITATGGIYISGKSNTPYLYYNTIRNNTYHGIYIYNAYANLRFNTITGSQTTGRAAIYCDYFAYPLFAVTSGGYEEGRNTMHNSYYGLYAGYYSNVSAGSNDIAYNNRFINNSYANVYATYNTTVYAKRNWWGQPTVNKVFQINGSVVYTDNPLPTDPGLGAPLQAFPFQETTVNSFEEVKGVVADIDSPTDDTKNSIAKLVDTYIKTKDKSIKDFLKDIVKNKSKNDEVRPLAMEVLANIYLYDKEFIEGVGINESLINDYKGTIHEKNGLMNMFFSNYEINDYKNAASYLSKIQTEFLQNEEVLFAKWLIGTETTKGAFEKQLKTKTEEEITPNSYQLIGNYPNPFNPTTIINYSIPVNSNVKISIYDITGSLIKSFDFNSQSSGYHNVEWDGTNESGIKVSSGTYIYRMEAVSTEGSAERFVQSKKMILIK